MSMRLPALPAVPTGAPAASAGLAAGIRARILAGMAAGAVFLGGFVLWSALAPIESAAIAPGIVKVETTRKTLQHLEGGVVAAIPVAEGAQVAAGQVLLRLDQTRARATLDSLTDQLWAALVEEARLRAELAARPELELPPELASRRGDAKVAEILAGQERILRTRRALLQANVAVVRERMAESRQEIEGQKAQSVSLARQLVLIEEEAAGVRELVNKGLERRPRLLALERARADLQGRRADVLAQTARAGKVIAEGEAQIASMQSDAEKEVAEQLRDARAQVADLREQARIAADVLARTEVRAPMAGTVTELRVHTLGGVVAPGEALMDLVPARDRLIVEVQIRPDDIHVVQVGQPAHVRLPAYRQRTTPTLAATLDYVSADRLTDKRSDQPYYLGRIVLDEKDLASRPEIKLTAGMQAEAMIITGSTSVALYTLSPILDVFRGALRDR